MSLPEYAMAAARRIAARSGAPVDAVISAYRAAAKGKAVNASSLFLGVGVITPTKRGKRTTASRRGKSAAKGVSFTIDPLPPTDFNAVGRTQLPRGFIVIDDPEPVKDTAE